MNPSDKDPLELLTHRDLDDIIDDLDLFLECIPRIAKMIGIDNVVKEIGLSKSSYYQRISDVDYWRISELKRVKNMFKKYNIGTINNSKGQKS